MQLSFFHQTYFDCFDDCLAGTVDYCGRNYRYIFMEKWNTLPHTPIIDANWPLSGQRLVVERYCGVSLELRRFYQYDQLAEYILARLAEGKPVMLEVDMYHLPWSVFFQKIHTGHCIVIHGHRKDDIFIVDDMTRQLRNLELKLRPGISSRCLAGTCTAAEEIPVSEEEFIDNTIIRRLKKETEELKGYEQFLVLAEEWTGNNEAVFAFPPENVESEWFAMELLATGNGRIAFAELLSYVTGLSGNHRFDEVIYDLKARGARWLTLRNRFMKQRIKGSWFMKSKEFMADFGELLEQDKKVYERFLFLGDRTNAVSITEPAAEAPARKMILDLTPYYNANAFNSHRFGNREGFDDCGFYYGLEI